MNVYDADVSMVSYAYSCVSGVIENNAEARVNPVRVPYSRIFSIESHRMMVSPYDK